MYQSLLLKIPKITSNYIIFRWYVLLENERIDLVNNHSYLECIRILIRRQKLQRRNVGQDKKTSKIVMPCKIGINNQIKIDCCSVDKITERKCKICGYWYWTGVISLQKTLSSLSASRNVTHTHTHTRNNKWHCRILSHYNTRKKTSVTVFLFFLQFI